MGKASDHCEKQGHRSVRRHGPSSFHMVEPEKVFCELQLKSGNTFLDLGCGLGDYAVAGAELVGDEGTVYALDRRPELVAALDDKVRSMELFNIKPLVADITKPLPLEDASSDVCLICTVLHIPGVSDKMKEIFDEVCRVLKGEGSMVIVECHKEEADYGPPLSMRLSPLDIERVMFRCGFERVRYVDIGRLYLAKYSKKTVSRAQLE